MKGSTVAVMSTRLSDPQPTAVHSYELFQAELGDPSEIEPGGSGRVRCARARPLSHGSL
jgi:hypothetical protein